MGRYIYQTQPPFFALDNERKKENVLDFFVYMSVDFAKNTESINTLKWLDYAAIAPRVK